MNKDFFKQLNILYVEDQEEIRNFTSNILSSIVHNLIICNDGEEGLEAFKNNSNIDLIIADINMPKMNGLEMIKRINQINSKIPSIVTTAHTDSSFYKKSIELGINSYCLKPLDLYELIKNITKCLEHKFLKKRLHSDEFNFNDSTLELLNKQDSLVAILKDGEVVAKNDIFSKNFKVFDINLEKILLDREQFFSNIEDLKNTSWYEFISKLDSENVLIKIKIADVTRIFKLNVTKIEKEKAYFLVSLFDITNLNEKSNLFEYKYNHDLITGLYNLNKFHKIFSIESKRVRRYRKDLSLIKLCVKNIDEKIISYEDFLSDISDLIKNNIREHDICFKAEKSSFLVLLPETDLDGALNVSYKLEDILNTMLANKKLSQHSCFGVVELKNDDNEELILQRVTLALNKALKSDDERVIYF
ncbi:response regulator receiver protein [Arcobacter nitrofigilis DSM 7299]|uniref:Response regulator receiver protein n=1 Tax=Arcobacter nitrofigilis (strain ATCC 33309 / DSM 7299 / CCUG 15893 / LMG 7604 / NCTC 12251 / CI) TaxID=572480 RepID=D5UZU0_ARCNC|nr:response regulator [Arcobacter nitrofigilis]ADG93309.1 response regulator receiver protein [Arcobacter nitrofigilis DSM 7299]